MLRWVMVAALGLASCSPGAAGPVDAAPVDVIARQFAVNDAGGAGRLLPNDRRIANYAVRLSRLQQLCREDVHALAGEMFKAYRTVLEAGKAVTLGQVLFDVDGTIPDGAAAAPCVERVAAWAARQLAQPAS